MKLQRSTLVLFVTAIALSGSVLIYENQRSEELNRQEAATIAEPLFAFTEADIQELFLQRLDAEILLENTATGWQMKAPRKATVEPAAVAYLLDFLTGKPTSQTLTVAAGDLAEFGLDQPRATVEFKLANGKIYRLRVGAPEFSGNTLYVQTLAPEDGTAAEAAAEAAGTEEVTIHTVSNGLASAIARPAQDWLVSEPADGEPTALPAEEQ